MNRLLFIFGKTIHNINTCYKQTIDTAVKKYQKQ